jgi:hypothetical protein
MLHVAVIVSCARATSATPAVSTIAATHAATILAGLTRPTP